MARPAPAATRAVDILSYLIAHPTQSFTLSELAPHLRMNMASTHTVLAVPPAQVDGLIARDLPHQPGKVHQPHLEVLDDAAQLQDLGQRLLDLDAIPVEPLRPGLPVPLVDGGGVNPSCATGGQKEWGNTVGQAAFIQRSGFGVTANGVEVYVAGPALSVCSLGRIMADAGVVRGMELE